jgi:hypothetical protein
MIHQNKDKYSFKSTLLFYLLAPKSNKTSFWIKIRKEKLPGDTGYIFKTNVIIILSLDLKGEAEWFRKNDWIIGSWLKIHSSFCRSCFSSRWKASDKELTMPARKASGEN